MKRIAIIEDNPDNRLLVRAIVGDAYQLDEYELGSVALARVADDGVDLLLVDISLPEMDGMEVVRRVRADAALRHLPTIALTAHAMAGDRERLLAAGFDDYVAKPIVDEGVLLSTLERWLSAPRFRRSAAGAQSAS
jgi:CheY-like chemotaxis protein